MSEDRRPTKKRSRTALARLQAEGIRRLGTPQRGFRYRDANGRAIAATERQRIESLKVPPAWQGALISPSPRARVQAMGKDRAGRWQYLYHPSQAERREREKARRLLAFVRALPKMREAVRRDLRRRGLPREKVLACALRILGRCFMRPGSEEYASANGSYGIATLRRKHVRVAGDRVVFDFPGKSGQQRHHELRDRTVARVLRQLLDAPGREVFQYRDADGTWHDVKRRHVTDYIKEVMGERFSAKDFRTWAGTLVCACALARAHGEAEVASRKKVVVAAVRETAAALGNTPAVCRSSYIHVGVLDGYERGEVLECYVSGVDELRAASLAELCRVERALVALLEGKLRAARKTAA